MLRLALLALLSTLACSGDSPGSASLTLGAYTTPREAYAAIVPTFAREWRARTGDEVEVRTSFSGSGALARAIASGFEADVAALSLEPDIQTLVDAQLVGGGWSRDAHGGIVTRSVVVIGVRAGNPQGIREWSDLARPGLEVLTPNVRTSGGAMWNVLAVVGAARRSGQSEEAALAGVLRNVRTMDRGARDSLLTFERGVGDAIITYENELLVGRARGATYEVVVPSSTILIENPVAVVDAHVDRHGNRELAEAFVAHLHTPEVQAIFAEHGLRSVDETVAARFADRFADVPDLFTVRDLGGWSEVRRAFFADGALYDRALTRGRGEAR